MTRVGAEGKSWTKVKSRQLTGSRQGGRCGQASGDAGADGA
jgi:hypothetical protein